MTIQPTINMFSFLKSSINSQCPMSTNRTRTPGYSFRAFACRLFELSLSNSEQFSSGAFGKLYLRLFVFRFLRVLLPSIVVPHYLCYLALLNKFPFMYLAVFEPFVVVELECFFDPFCHFLLGKAATGKTVLYFCCTDAC